MTNATAAATKNAGLDHIRASVPEAVADKSALVRRIETFHVSTRHDIVFSAELDKMLATILADAAQEGYLLAVVGKSGAGKSHTIKRRLDAHPAFKPFSDGLNEMQICLRVRTPADCNTKSLGVAILHHVGYPLVRSSINEIEIWRLVREQLKRREIRIIYLDEAQHVLKAKKKLRQTTDTIKSLMQDADWPIWIIMSGIPEMLDVITHDADKQLERRSRVVPIGDMNDDDVATVTAIVEALAKRVSLKVGFPLTSEFMRRLMHGGIWRQGMIIQLIKLSIEVAIWDKQTDKTKAVSFDHFKEGYRRLCNCTDDTNVFIAKEWQDIIREVDEDGTLTEATVKA